jgi:GrpB-like predicted nucleotidyltransferase (UPF0157 family)
MSKPKSCVRRLKRKSWKNVPVEICEYDATWLLKFEKQKNDIMKAIGNKVAAIEHIGSTAVPGLGAKPIIDIMVGLQKLGDADDCIEPLKKIGYEYVPELEAEIPERRYFHKGPSNVPKKHYHLHMVQLDGEFWKRQILFRDYLSTHSDLAQEYFRLKKELAARYRLNREAYTEAKTSFIKSTIAKARSEKSISTV